ncbi:hypothetical protein PENANT_c028G07789 [Penicillium antarcticum]|uniref:FAD/NAD(P)-binding domain-containing protein n=1 Tax=Penicillium antarcticum TaxID=416450 RepID=A0A1V6PXA0_9EURO|nr:hypothetical protein PENANT_c028G07789 [Penicillium antarcticum]
MAINVPPSRQRVEPGSFDIPLGELPETNKTTPENPDEIATEIIRRLNTTLVSGDKEAIAEILSDNGYWRDHLCFSWDLRTVKDREDIIALTAGQENLKIEIDRGSPLKAPHAGPIDAFGEVHGIEFFIKITTKNGAGSGVVRLAQYGEEWKIFTVFTSLASLFGCDEAIRKNRPTGVQHGAQQGRQNWQDRRIAEEGFEEKGPAVLIVGAGQGGLTAAARLKMLNVDTLIVDNEKRIGDSWRKRYHQLVLHDPVWYDHMPYLPFPECWPIFTPKDKLADFFESYVKLLELNVWTQTEIMETKWEEDTKRWKVMLYRSTDDERVERHVLYPRHIVQATGHSGKKKVPIFKGMDGFKGDRICHSSEFTGAKPDSKGKKAVVVGSCNSGHDIAQDYYEKGYDVTMVQRSSTCVITSDSIVNIGLKGLYEEGGPPTEDADLYLYSIPPPLLKAQQIKVTKMMNQNDAKTLEGLEKVGFKVDMGPMDAGLIMKYFQRGGGYYIDVGGSQLIIDGKVKVKQGQEISEIRPKGIAFADGSTLDADEIILATGYQNMRSNTRLIFGDEVADRVGDVWGLNQEGEFRTIWQRSGHPGFWFMGGNLALCRYYSRILALQIKAIEEGITTY